MLRGKLPPSGERWLRECGGRCEENLHRLASGGYGSAVEVARKISTVWRAVATGARWRLRGKSPPSGERWLREGVEVARKISTVWRAVATGERWLREGVDVARKTTTVWRAVATGARWRLRGKSPPSGERWLRASGGYGRAVATGGGGRSEENLHRLASGGYGRGWMLRGKSPPSSNRSHRCQAVDVARKTTTVWRAVATGAR